MSVLWSGIEIAYYLVSPEGYVGSLRIILKLLIMLYYTNHPMNVKESAEAWIIELRAVGLEKNDISVNYDPEGYIKIKSTKELDESLYNRIEFRPDHFDTLIQLPSGIDSENITAEVRNGMLIITVPKDKNKGTREISIL